MFELNYIVYIFYVNIPNNIMCIKLYYELNIIILISLIKKRVFALNFVSNSNVYCWTKI